MDFIFCEVGFLSLMYMYFDLTCFTMAQAVVASLAEWRPRFDLGEVEEAIRASFVVDKVSMRQVFLLSNFSLPVCFH